MGMGKELLITRERCLFSAKVNMTRPWNEVCGLLVSVLIRINDRLHYRVAYTHVPLEN